MPNDLDTLFASFDRSKAMQYTQYWRSIRPRTDDEYFRRWLFAFLSIHTQWTINVRAYKEIAMETWRLLTHKQVFTLLKDSRVGLYNVRSKGIHEFASKFFEAPHAFMRHRHETLREMRERLINKLYGIGIAKISFAIEMCYPTGNIVCLDTHMLRFFGKPASVSRSTYLRCEQAWIEASHKHNLPPFIARNLYWDSIQKQENTTYWSHVFHEDPVAEWHRQRSAKPSTSGSNPTGVSKGVSSVEGEYRTSV